MRLSILGLLSISGALFAQDVPVVHEKWIDVEGFDSGFFQYEEHSLTEKVNGTFQATWRRGAKSANDSFEIETAVVNCEGLGYTLLKQIVRNPQVTTLQGQAHDLTYDYIDKTTQSNLVQPPRAIPMFQKEHLSRHVFPDLGSRAGKFIERMCSAETAAMYDNVQKRASTILATLPVCKDQQRNGHPFCTKDPAILTTFASTMLRATQATEWMPQHSALVKEMLSLALATHCSDTRSCLMPLRNFEYTLSKDMSHFIEGDESAPNLQQAKATYAEQKARQDQVTRFWSCVSQNIKELDDNLSSADIIATAVFGVCKSSMSMFTAEAAVQLEAAVRPNIIAKILSARKATSKTSPKRVPQAKANS